MGKKRKFDSLGDPILDYDVESQPITIHPRSREDRCLGGKAEERTGTSVYPEPVEEEEE